MTIKKMPETMYRASRYFRVLGNPTAYLILRSLEKGPKTPTELSKELGKALTTISDTLRNLRQVNLVRYESSSNTKKYWIKDERVLKMLDQAEKLVESMRKKKE